LGSAYFEAAGAALRRRVDELVIDMTFCHPDGAFTEPDIDSQNVPGAAYDPFLDRLSWAQATAFLAPTLEARPTARSRGPSWRSEICCATLQLAVSNQR